MSTSGSSLLFEQGINSLFSGLDTIVVFENLMPENNIKIEYSENDTNSLTYTWFSVNEKGEKFIYESNGFKSSIEINNQNDHGEGTYKIQISSLDKGTINTLYIAVINYANHKVNISEIVIHDNGETPNTYYNRCKTAYLEAKYTQNSIMVYDPKLGVEQELKPYQKIFDWTWGTGTQKRVYESITSVAASFEEVNYAVKISDNFFYEKEDDKIIGEATANKDYEPIAVKAIINHKASHRIFYNESDSANTSDGTLTGSSPIDVTLEADYPPTSAIQYFEWSVYQGEKLNRIATNNTDLFRYNFTRPIENPESSAADYMVKLVVSNEYSCSDTANLDIKLEESHLAIANLFVIGFGATLEYKADYRSLRPGTFRGYIYSRNGRRVFQWTDPSKGWDGRMGGTGGFVQPGMYVVVLRAKGSDGIDYKIRHSLTIVREK